MWRVDMLRMLIPRVLSYDVASNTWVPVADMLDGRSFCGATTIGFAGTIQEQDLFDALITKASSGW
jgi:hypothetical protein